jgi:hypothetical protein
MSKLARLVLVIMIALLSMFASTPAPSLEIQKHPGYIAFDSAELLNGSKAEAEINLEGPVLRMLCSFAGEQDQELNKILPQLKLVSLKVFKPSPEKSAEITNKVTEFINTLKSTGWSSVIHVPKEEEKVDIMVKAGTDKIEGFSLFVIKPGEFVFINIVGDINPEEFGRQIGKITGNFMKGMGNMPDFQKMFTQNQGAGKEPSFIVKGTVTDEASGKPLEKVWVGDHKYGKEPYLGSFTDKDGKYQYKTYPEEHNINAKIEGYKTKVKTMTSTLIQGGTEITLDFALSKE